MSHIRSGALGYGLSILTIIVLIILLTITLFRLNDIQRAMRNNVSTNMMWVLYQTHINSLMLSNAIQHHLLNQKSSHEVAHHYQIFLSRINMLNDGPQKRRLQDIGIADRIAIQTELVKHLSTRIDSDETT